ncbi:hypothetical protein JAO78_000185 [Alishewanella sp. 16-MA]|uniref:DUF4340 domain-containing protein n=1 Tax=Alishewanella maricola TaxID=2795740 RepID=A0ABS8BYV0_9ALTE|nr:hypothetical protein [Alishewanella maricola]MCB5225233.1 hypothetical protein [Alishewanella maricola]
MLKLSRRNWNNVLIFVVLLLMFSLYDWSGNTYFGRAERVSLLPDSSQLLSVSIGSKRLVQAAGQWQWQPHQPSTVSATEMAAAWQTTQLVASNETAGANWVPIAQASVQLVGQFEPQIWLLYLQPSGYLVQQVGRTQLYLLAPAHARLLFTLE